MKLTPVPIMQHVQFVQVWTFKWIDLFWLHKYYGVINFEQIYENILGFGWQAVSVESYNSNWVEFVSLSVQFSQKIPFLYIARV